MHLGACGYINFYPRSPRGERRNGLQVLHRRAIFLSTLPARGATSTAAVAILRTYISIHAPREGSDMSACAASLQIFTFLSTLPARGATARAVQLRQRFQISIHAPREGSDASEVVPYLGHIISIHAPREGSDRPSGQPAAPMGISIHAPREGSDRFLRRIGGPHSDFYPRSPRGERQMIQ